MKLLSSTDVNQRGFTLIELSIVLIITSLMLVGALQAYQIYNEKQKIERMNSFMADVSLALEKFPTMIEDPAVDRDKAFNRMPCPAPLDGRGHGNNYSSEVRNGAGVCQDVLTVAGLGGDVFIGKFPAASLKIRNDYMKDIYGNYLIYAVSAVATQEATYNEPGAITIEEEIINEDPVLGTIGEIIALPDKNNVQYALLSMGDSGAGALNFNGEVIIPCDATSKEAENCINPAAPASNDATFMASVYSERNTRDFYDDRVEYEAFLPTVIDEETPSCKQSDGFATPGNACPDGWEVDTDMAGALPLNFASSLENASNLSYLNIHPDTEDYYFTPRETPFTKKGVSTSLNSFDTTYCVKSAANKAKTNCFTKEVKVSGAVLGSDVCPSGTYEIDSGLDTPDTLAESSRWVDGVVVYGVTAPKRYVTCGK